MCSAVDPKSGIDCSGLILVVMRDKAGLDLDHYSASQATEGVAVSADQMRPGDIIAYDGQPRDGKVNHIAIYVGDGKAIHARGKTRACRLRLGTMQSRLQFATCSVTEYYNRILTRQLRLTGFLLL